MPNPLEAIFDEGKELIFVGLLVVVALIIFGTLATLPGAPPEAKAIAEQSQETISWLWLFYLGLPSIGIIVAIIWFVRKVNNISTQI